MCTWKQLVDSTVATVKTSQYADERSIIVSSRLRLLIVVPLIRKVVISIGPSDKSPNKQIWITSLPGVPSIVTSPAGDKRGVHLNRHDRRSTVVNLSWIIAPVSHHVASCSRVITQDVIHLQQKAI